MKANFIEDPDTGELMLEIPETLWNELGWQIGETVEWITQDDGSCIIKKVENV